MDERLTARGVAPGWPFAIAAVAATLLVALLAFRTTAVSLVRVWADSETFAHGFLVAPVSAYLVWARRDALRSLVPRPYPPALAILPILGLVWLVGHATSTLLVEQFCLVSLVPVLVTACVGPSVARSIAFPLGFLYFAVPFGDVLQPSLMKWTASIAVHALHLSGVSIATAGLHIYTDAAHWRIAEACSGLNYLVSGFALASLFGYLTYRKTWKRVACVGLVVIVLVVANGVRAYAVILYGELTEMHQGRGFDHYAFGWLLYLAVMAVYLAFASLFRDPEAPAGEAVAAVGGGSTTAKPPRLGRWAGVTASAAGLVAVWPLLYGSLWAPGPEAGGRDIPPPPPRNGWTIGPERSGAWRPNFTGAASETIAVYHDGEAAVTCYVAVYERQREGRELFQYQNVVVDPPDPRWRVVGESKEEIDAGGERLAVRETNVRGPGEQLLLWHWYWLPDEFTTSPGWAKVLQARATLLWRRDRAAVVVLAARGADRAEASTQLHRFVRTMLPSIRSSLRRTDASD